jgi:hypothetical protein
MFGFNLNNLGSMITIIVAVPFVLIALAFLFGAMRARRKANAAQSWNTVMGRILSADVEPRRSHSEHGYTTSYYPVVMYEYQVNGQRFMGSRINFGAQVGYGSANWAQKTIMRYQTGGMVEVYYDPNDPTQSVLERSAGSGSRILVLVAVLIFVILGVTVAFTMGINQFVSQVTSSFIPR